MELTTELKTLFIETAKTLKSSDRRVFMAQVVTMLGKGGQRRAEEELGWNRGTIRLGMYELESGFRCVEAFSARGRNRAEDHLPHLLDDIKAILDDQSQADPTFKTTRLFTRMSVAEVRRQLIEQKGYTDAQLPCEETIRTKINQLGYTLRSVQKSRPKKKVPKTDAIFNQLDKMHKEAEKDESVLRISLDAKATVLVGLFSRKGKTRVIVKAADHDFKPEAKLTPFGIFLPQNGELYLYFTTSAVTSDFIVDCLQDVWMTIRDRFRQVQTLMLNLDNGPENHSRRTQFMKRLTDFVDDFQVTIQLAHYPPYHSKYNPIERVWGVLENHWNGSLLDSVETVLSFAQSMTWKGQQPIVQLVEKTYHPGAKLTQRAMAELEKRFERLPGLERWFVRITPVSVPQ